MNCWKEKVTDMPLKLFFNVSASLGHGGITDSS